MIGVLGGSFDPIHLGHLHTANEVMQILSLEEIRVVPSNVPPHRNGPAASANQRVRLIQMALKRYVGMRIDCCEVEREGPSYTRDTLLHIKEEVDRPLCLIIGQDAFEGFLRWHCWEEILELAHLIVMTRPGFQKRSAPVVLSDRIVLESQSLLLSKAGKLFFCNVSALDISSSMIRTRLRQGSDCQKLMPYGVLELINKEKIYN